MPTLVWRVPSAIAATWIGAALGGALLIVAMLSLIDSNFRPPAKALPLILGGLFFWGLIFAAIPATVLGLVWELPLALLVGNRPVNSLPMHIAMSALAGCALLAFAAWASHFVRPIGRPEGMPLIAMIGAVGGICSSIAWSWLVYPFLASAPTD